MTLLPNKIFYIEGNIGSGKSTLLRNLKKNSQLKYRDYGETDGIIYQIKKMLFNYYLFLKNYYYPHDNNKNYDNGSIVYIMGKKILFLEEPLNEWEKITDPTDGKNILQKFYDNPKKYAFSFQVMSLQTRSQQLLRAIKENPDAIIVSERSIYTDCNIFAKMLFDNGKIDPLEKEVYNLIFNNTCKIIDGTVQKTIYLKSIPENTFIKKCERNRPGEENISIEYLKNCDTYHNNEFSNSDLIINIDDYPIDSTKYNILLKSLIHFITN